MPPPSAAFHRSDNASAYRDNAAFVFAPASTAPVRQLLDLQPQQRVLDVGCGSGELTASLAEAVHPGLVVGVDASRDMINTAYMSAPPALALRYSVLDGHDLYPWLRTEHLAGTFDCVFSNAALHWMRRDPLAVAQGMRAALRPGGQLVLEMGGQGNVGAVHALLREEVQAQGIKPDIVDPWYFPSAEEYTRVLTQAGFKVEHIALVVRPTLLPSGVHGWLQAFGGPFLNEMRDRDAAVTNIISRLQAGDTRAEGEERWFNPETNQWTAHYVRLRAKAIAC